MRQFVIQRGVNETFWERYARLWQQSQGRSPFQAPGILRYFSSISGADSLAFEMLINNELRGAVVLRIEKGNLVFLSDIKSDSNSFVFHVDCMIADMEFFFNEMAKTLREQDWTVSLNKVQGWTGHVDLLRRSSMGEGLFWECIDYSVCPALETDSPEELFKAVNRSRQYRYAANRIRKAENGHFEIFNDDTDLDNWVNDFCLTHIKRWKGTPTPSVYNDGARIEFLKECYRSWIADKVLVRYSAVIDGKRVGFSANLLDDHSIIGHSTTYDPAFSKFSPGKALLFIMCEWLVQKGIRKLDFGYGDEEYKYSLANKDQVLNRIFISKRKNLLFMLKAKAINAVRTNRGLYDFYRDKIKTRLNRINNAKTKNGHSEE